MRRIAAVSILLALVAVAWLYWEQTRPRPLVVSGFVEADQIRVGSRVGGRVASVAVQEGDRAPQGETLYALEPFDLHEQLAHAEAQAAAAEADLQRLQSGYRVEEVEEAAAQRDHAAATLQRLVRGPRPQEIEIARQQLKEAAANLEWAQSEYERLKRLRAEDVAAMTEFREHLRYLRTSQATAAAARQRLLLLEEGTRPEEIAEARAQLAAADATLSKFKRGYRPEEIAEAAAQLAAARAEVAAIRIQITELAVVSPCDCVVEAIDLRPGDLVAAGAPSVSLLDTSRLWVRAYVPEDRLGRVAGGDLVSVHVDGFPERRFKARVTFIATEAEFTPQNVQTPEERSKQVFRIKATLEEGMDVLRVGMWADVLFERAASAERADRNVSR